MTSPAGADRLAEIKARRGGANPDAVYISLVTQDDTQWLIEEVDRLTKLITDWTEDEASKGWDGDFDALLKHSEEQAQEIERLRALLMEHMTVVG